MNLMYNFMGGRQERDENCLNRFSTIPWENFCILFVHGLGQMSK